MKYIVECAYVQDDVPNDKFTITVKSKKDLFSAIAKQLGAFEDFEKFGEPFHVCLKAVELPLEYDRNVISEDDTAFQYDSVIVTPLSRVEDVTDEVVEATQEIVDELIKKSSNQIAKETERYERRLLAELKQKYES